MKVINQDFPLFFRKGQHPPDPAHPCLPQGGVQARGGLCEVRGGGQVRVQSQAVRGLVNA